MTASESRETPSLRSSHLVVEDRVAWLTLDRDDVRNELTGTGLAGEIVSVVSWVNETPDVSVLVIAAAGSCFSAGGNIKDMQARAGLFGGGAGEIETGYRHGIQRMALALEAIEVPTIAAINGPAVGAGFDLACMCDIRLAARGARMGETFINLGIIPGDGGAWFLQRLIGYEQAALLTFTGRLIDAETAAALGLVSEVVEDELLAERTRALANEVAAKPPTVIRLTKRLMRHARTSELPELLELSAALQAICHGLPEHREALDAFLEKRKTDFGS
jgi:enoyl-CoA hydratase/carnithine racemase